MYEKWSDLEGKSQSWQYWPGNVIRFPHEDLEDVAREDFWASLLILLPLRSG